MSQMKNIQPKKSSRLFILLGGVLTILSMIGVYAISSGSSKNAGNGTTPILVASRVIPSRTVFASASDVAQWMTTVNVPVSSAPPQYFTSVQAFVKTELATGKVYNSVTLIPKEEALSSMFT